MRYKVPVLTSQVNEDAAVLRLRRVDGNTKRRIVETLARRGVELPPVPRAADDACASQAVRAGLALDAALHAPEAQRPAVMRTAVADAARLAVHEDNADFSAAGARDDAAVPFELGRGTDVVPVAQAAATLRRSP
jgi:hypothetical protein